MALIHENYVGVDGATLSGTLTPTGTTGGTCQINADRARIVSPATSYGTKRRAITGLANGDLLVTVELTTVAEHYPEVAVRATSTTTVGNAYAVQLDPSGGQVLLSEYVAGDDSILDTAAFAFAVGKYRLRIRFNGSNLQVRLWAYASTEPDTWLLEATDATVTAAGSIHFACIAGFAATARTVYFDDLYVNDLSITPGDGTQAATALGWGTPTYAEQFTSAAATIDGVDTGWTVFSGPGYQGRGTFSRSQIAVHDGALTLFADQAAASAAVGFYPTEEMYGRWEVRMRIPYGVDAWRAVLLLWPYTNEWPRDGEVDFAELPTGLSDGSGIIDVHYNQHWGTEDPEAPGEYIDNQSINVMPSVNVREWHNYAIDWNPDSMAAYVDGALVDDAPILYSEYPYAFPPGPMRLGIQLDCADENIPLELREPAAMEIAWVRRYAVEDSPGGGGSAVRSAAFLGML